MKISSAFFLSFEDYTPAFSRLAFAKKSSIDLFGSSIPDARCHLAKCLQTLTSTRPKQVRTKMSFDFFFIEKFPLFF